MYLGFDGGSLHLEVSDVIVALLDEQDKDAAQMPRRRGDPEVVNVSGKNGKAGLACRTAFDEDMPLPIELKAARRRLTKIGTCYGRGTLVRTIRTLSGRAIVRFSQRSGAWWFESKVFTGATDGEIDILERYCQALVTACGGKVVGADLTGGNAGIRRRQAGVDHASVNHVRRELSA